MDITTKEELETLYRIVHRYGQEKIEITLYGEIYTIKYGHGNKLPKFYTIAGRDYSLQEMRKFITNHDINE